MPSEPEAASPPHDGLPLVSPDQGEEEGLDDIVPTRGYALTPVVGLGASAGGIQALVKFFGAMPSSTGMAFVVILHLSPHHESTVAHLLSRHTSMPVVEAEDAQRVEPNHVYVIPRRKYLTVHPGRLQLSQIESYGASSPARGKRVQVDMFFRSLADSHGPHAVAIVLSGVDGDGALGIKRVKERGGLTIVQDPEEAEHSGMPRSAIATGMVDWVLKAEDIPARLVAYLESEAKLRLPPEEAPRGAVKLRPEGEEWEGALRDILLYLRTRTGRDFAYYKRATVLRRIGRRMQVNGIATILEYVPYIRSHPGEAGALLQDMLISVTNFFRDREAFEALEARLPELLSTRMTSEQLRIWVPACATGEEAYSLAILFSEYLSQHDSPPPLQVFACDLNDEAIQIARAGYYPASLEADVDEGRLKRFFVKERQGYRIRREIREMVLFASHDLLQDAPFSRMDLISCRNLLIYLGRDAQQRTLDTFHMAMRPGGLLFLGTSEAVEEGSGLFRPIDTKNRIYVHQPGVRSSAQFALEPATYLRALHATEHVSGPPVVHGRRFGETARVPFQQSLGRTLDRVALAELHFRMIERYAPPSVVVNGDHDVVHLSEHAGTFLHFTGGEPTMNLTRVVSLELRVELRAALFRAAESHTRVDVFRIPAEVAGRRRAVDMHIMPAPELAPGYLLVVFEARDLLPSRPASSAEPSALPADASIQIERELEQVKGHLRDTVEQYEASTEELKASNEELQAMNEELRSATEELETSREELQSINEELSTVNQEMKRKVDELASTNSDLQNLMASTSIATVFLDRELTIMLYTPNAAGIFNLIPGDVGRPLAHLKHKLDYPSLIPDAEQVLRTLIPVDREVSDGEKAYLARVQPYRTVEDHIAGAVLTLVDVTDRNRATEALRLSEERMRLLIESAKDWAIFTLDSGRVINGWNKGATALFGYVEEEVQGRSADVLFTPEDRAAGDAEKEIETARIAGRAQNERWHLRKDGSRFYGSGSVMPLRDDAGHLRGFVKIMRDLTESKHTQEALGEHMAELTRFNAVAVDRELRMIELKREINELCVRLGDERRYVIVDDADPALESRDG